jgi:hypothetical protein
VYLYLTLPVTPSSRRWVQRINRQPTKDQDQDELQFLDLTPTDLEVGSQDLIIRPRIGNPHLQLAAPQSMTAIPQPDTVPPKSIGYDVFALKMDSSIDQEIAAASSISKRLESPGKGRRGA